MDTYTLYSAETLLKLLTPHFSHSNNWVCEFYPKSIISIYLIWQEIHIPR